MAVLILSHVFFKVCGNLNVGLDPYVALTLCILKRVMYNRYTLL